MDPNTYKKKAAGSGSVLRRFHLTLVTYVKELLTYLSANEDWA